MGLIERGRTVVTFEAVVVLQRKGPGGNVIDRRRFIQNPRPSVSQLMLQAVAEPLIQSDL